MSGQRGGKGSEQRLSLFQEHLGSFGAAADSRPTPLKREPRDTRGTQGGHEGGSPSPSRVPRCVGTACRRTITCAFVYPRGCVPPSSTTCPIGAYYAAIVSRRVRTGRRGSPQTSRAEGSVAILRGLCRERVSIPFSRGGINGRRTRELIDNVSLVRFGKIETRIVRDKEQSCDRSSGQVLIIARRASGELLRRKYFNPKSFDHRVSANVNRRISRPLRHNFAHARLEEEQ